MARELEHFGFSLMTISSLTSGSLLTASSSVTASMPQLKQFQLSQKAFLCPPRTMRSHALWLWLGNRKSLQPMACLRLCGFHNSMEFNNSMWTVVMMQFKWSALKRSVSTIPLEIISKWSLILPLLPFQKNINP